ncbi:MAG: hypothetical protein ACOH19_17340 [Rhodoglobus sp.]
MTTFHDPQPQSRREKRASERGENAEPSTEQPVPLVEPEVRAPQFTTQPPVFNAEQFRSRVDARENAAVDPTQAMPKVDQESYRRRSETAQPAAQQVTPPPAAEAAPAATPPGEQTMTRRELRALREAGIDPQSVSPQPAVPGPVSVAQLAPAEPASASITAHSWDQPFSSPAVPTPIAEVPAVVFPDAETTADVTPVPSSEPQAWPFGAPLAPSAAESQDTTPEVAPTVVEAPVEEPASASSPFSFFRRSKRASQAAEPEAVAEPELPAEPDTAAEPVAQVEAPAAAEAVLAPVVTPADLPRATPVVDEVPIVPAAAPQEQAAPSAQGSGVSPFDALFTPKGAEPTSSDQSLADATPITQAWSAPVGHWSTQADLDDEAHPHTINRSVGTGSSATNALVLPSIPLGSDIRGPLTENGRITLTGSIDLSHSLGSTGAPDRLENTSMDALFDMHDSEAVSTDSAPVRAIRAVSTHNTGHGVTHTQKPKGNRALTGLLIAASSMAVVVAGLLVAALAFNLF